MAFERERPVVARARAAMKLLREAIDEGQATLDQWNALGAAPAFAGYGADASWASDNGNVSIADVTDGVATLNALSTLWSTSSTPAVGPHRTNIAKGSKP